MKHMFMLCLCYADSAVKEKYLTFFYVMDKVTT